MLYAIKTSICSYVIEASINESNLLQSSMFLSFDLVHDIISSLSAVKMVGTTLVWFSVND